MTNDQASFEAELGYAQKTSHLVDVTLRMMPNSAHHKAYAALALALARDSQRSETLLNEAIKDPALGTLMTNNTVPCVRGAIELDRGHPARAIEELQRAIPYDLASDSAALTLYLRGSAYLGLKAGKEAAAQFQKILDNHGLVSISVNWPLAHLGLARSYALIDDTSKARTAYQDFLTLWKDADPDIPILKQAKTEFAKLQ